MLGAVEAMPETDIDAILKSHPLFAGLPQPLIDAALETASVTEVGAQHKVFKQDAPAEHMYIVMDGAVEVEVPALMGPPAVIQHLQAGAPLGWSWLLPPYRWHFDCRAVEASRLLTLDGRALREFCESHPEMGYELMKRTASMMQERLEAARKQVMDAYDGT